jgi:hypothetical protein
MAAATAAKRTRPTPAARARAEADAARIEHITKALEAAQKDLAGVGGSLGAGARDLGRDVTRMLRDARRDPGKMRKAIQRDLDRLQRDLAAAAGQGALRRRTPASARTAQRRTAH